MDRLTLRQRQAVPLIEKAATDAAPRDGFGLIETYDNFDEMLSRADDKLLRQLVRRHAGKHRYSEARSNCDWVPFLEARGDMDAAAAIIADTIDFECEVAWLAGVAYGMASAEARADLLRIGISTARKAAVK